MINKREVVIDKYTNNSQVVVMSITHVLTGITVHDEDIGEFRLRIRLLKELENKVFDWFSGE